ncbi:MAG: protein kinase domain-containing protein, partial [Pseudonocardiaceae bacterium]
MTARQGRLIAGRYRLIEQIGNGAMGVVWRARDEVLDRTVAVKELLLGAGRNATETDRARQRALREGRIAARLQHANAIAVYDVADEGGHPVLIMEYLPSRSLADVLAERHALSPDQAIDIGAQASSALAAAHAAGIVHRDVKPGNILLGPDGTTKITDFGISRAVGDVTVTATGLFAGTPAFLSPEVAQGAEPTAASDVFSLGATLYAAVEGTPPFGTSENPIALLHAVSSGRVTPPRNAGRLAEPLMRMLADDPADRPTMAAIHAELRAPAAGRGGRPAAALPATLVATSPAPQHPATQIDPQPGGSTPRRALILGAVALLAVAAVVGFAMLGNRGGVEAPIAGPAQPATMTTSAPDEPATSADLEQAVSEYYALLPQDTDAGWERLGPGLQAQGKADYAQFWSTISDLTVTAPPRAAGNTVTVGIAFTVDDRGRFREVHELGMVVADGVALIDSDRV